MDQLVHRYAEDALAPATKRTYRDAQARYLAFFTSYNLPSVPVSQPVLCRFAALLASQHLLHSSIKAYLLAVRHLHVASCGVDPGLGEMVVLQGVLQGIKRAQARDQGHSPRLRLPVTAGVLISLKAAWEQQGPSFDRTMLWAVACTWIPPVRRCDGPLTVGIRSVRSPFGRRHRRGLPAQPKGCVRADQDVEDRPFPKGSLYFLGQDGL